MESDAEGAESAALAGRQTKKATEMAPNAVCECSVPQRFHNLGDIDEVIDQRVKATSVVGFGPQQVVQAMINHLFALPTGLREEFLHVRRVTSCACGRTIISREYGD